MNSRIVELKSIYNMRDLGGLRTRSGSSTVHGVLFRSDSLDNPSEPDHAILWSQLRIAKIIDLRTFEEVRNSTGGDRRPSVSSEASTVHIPLIAEGRIGREPFPSDNPRELAKVYLENVTTGATAVRRIVTEIADSVSRQDPCVFHCAAGRDRTGVIAGVVLEFLEVERSEIAADYVQSNHHAREVTLELKRSPLYKNSSTLNENAVLLLHAETIMIFLDLLEERFGGAVEFLRTIGVEDADLSVLRSGMLP